MGKIAKTKSPKACAYGSGGATPGDAAASSCLAFEGAASFALKALALMFAALIAAMFFAGSAYADSGLSGSIPDNDVDASGEDATMISADDFKDKVYTITSGGTYKLAEDIEDGQIKVAGNAAGAKITLDLNGCSLSSKTSGQSALYIYSGVTEEVVLDVVDTKTGGSIVQGENTGAFPVSIGTKYYRNKVTLGNVKIVSKSSGCQCVVVFGCDLTIDGATLQTEDGTAAELIYAENAVKSTCGITLNSGTFLVASDAGGLFKFGSTDWGYPSLALNGGTYNRNPVSENFANGKIIWKTDEGYTIDDAADKPGKCKCLVKLSETKELWFTSEAEAKSFTESSEAGGKTFRKVSFATDADKPSVDTPAQYIADGLCAIEPDDPSSDDYKFNHWKNGDSAYNFSNKVTADLTLTADWSLYVAQVGTSKFTSVKEAVSEAPADGIVELLRDIEGRVYLTEYSRAVTIDLKGHTIKNVKSGNQAIMVLSPKADVSLTITDSGNASGAKGAIIQEAEGESAIRVDTLASTPRLNLKGVEIRSAKTECLQMIKGSAELNDVTMSVDGVADSLIYTASSLGVSVNSGTYTAADGMDLITKVGDESKTVLNGGSFNIFPANGTLAEGKVLRKSADSTEAKGYFEVVAATDVDFAAIAAVVEYSDAKIYFEDASEAAAFVEKHAGATLAKCVTATISVPESLVYDGNVKEVQVDLSGIDDGDDVKAVVEYSGDRLVEGKPVTAGSYTAKVTGLSGDDAGKYALRSLPEKAIEIQKAGTTITLAEPDTKTIGDEFKLSPSAYDGAAFTYESDNPTVASVFEDGTVKVNAAGTAKLTVKTAGDGNHADASKSVTLTAKAADLSAAKVTLSKASFTYNG
ncbi:MAG: Ig-like domain-containing protein, partial [Coriobacteriia bacterium]|nr:Ig-like domain-containing protein [Coriobacteriia bacterium]